METAYFIGLDNEDGSQRQVLVEQESDENEEGIINEYFNAFNFSIEGEKAGHMAFTDDYSNWEYHGDLSHADQEVLAEVLHRRFRKADSEHSPDLESFSFETTWNEVLAVVHVTPKEGVYRIAINGEYKGNVELDDDGNTWKNSNFSLDTSLVQEIGRKIEDHYA